MQPYTEQGASSLAVLMRRPYGKVTHERRRGDWHPSCCESSQSSRTCR